MSGARAARGRHPAPGGRDERARGGARGRGRRRRGARGDRAPARAAARRAAPRPERADAQALGLRRARRGRDRPGRGPAARRHAGGAPRCAPTRSRRPIASGCWSPRPSARSSTSPSRARRPTPDAIGVTAGDLDGFLVVALPAPALDPATLDELVPLAFDEHAAGVDRLARRRARGPRRRARRRRLREPIGAGHPLRIAEAVARLGGRPGRPALGRGARGAVYPLLDPERRAPRRAARGPRSRPARRAADPPAAQRHGQVGRLPHGLRPPGARLRRQRPPARPGGGRGAARGRPAGREALGRPAPRLPQPPPRGRHPPADRHGRGAGGAEAAAGDGDSARA